MTCVEVQRHIHDAAQTFTRLLGLGNVCVHECVDVFDGASGDTNRGDANANFANFSHSLQRKTGDLTDRSTCTVEIVRHDDNVIHTAVGRRIALRKVNEFRAGDVIDC